MQREFAVVLRAFRRLTEMIKRIKIRDFKSIRELDVELGPVTVLVGRSGTGKSNFVQAIRFLRNLLLNPGEAVNYEGGWGRILPVGEKEPGLSITVEFSVPGEDADYEYQLRFGVLKGQLFANTAPTVIREGLKLGDKHLFLWVHDGRAITWEHAPNLASVPRPTGTVLLGNFPSLQKVVYAFAALSTGIGYYHLPSTVLDARGGNGQRNNLWTTISGLWDDAGNYRDTMRAIIQDFNHPDVRKGLLASLQAVNPSIASIELDSLTNPTRAIVGHDIGGTVLELSLEQESDGLRRFYAHLLALYQTPSKLSLIFEEPENAIFPGALSLLADEFKAAPRENRGQVILTTHSPGLLDAFDVNDIRVVDLQDGKTVIGPVGKEQRDAVRDRLLKTGELLTVDRPRIDEPSPAEQKV